MKKQLSLEQLLQSNNENSKLFSCVTNIIKNIPVLSQTTSQLEDALSFFVDCFKNQIYVDMNCLLNPSKQISNKYFSAIENVSNLGFDVEAKTNSHENFWVVSTHENQLFFMAVSKTISFDGICLTSKDFEAGNNPFEQKLMKYLNDHPSNGPDYEKALEHVESLKRNKLALKLSSSKQKELKDAELELAKAKNIYDTVDKMLEAINKYKSLSKEDVLKFKTLFLVYDELESLSEQVELLMHKMEGLEGSENKNATNNIVHYVDSAYTSALSTLNEEAVEVLNSAPSVLSEMLKTMTSDELEALTLPIHNINSGFSPKQHIAKTIYQGVENHLNSAFAKNRTL